MKSQFEIGTVVYQRVCSENVGMITAQVIREGSMTYLVMWSNLEEGEHAAAELTDERDFRGTQSS